MLSCRLPRDPSAPRTALLRRLRRLGVAQISDGLVALPADARTREQLEWLAEDVAAARGTAGVWLAHPATEAQERELAARPAGARAAEYRLLAGACRASLDDGEEAARVLRRLRSEFRAVTRTTARTTARTVEPAR